MFFTLEIVQAKNGDCLLLHYGRKNDPKVILVDGGPGGVYKNFLRKRLIEIKNELSPNASLPLSMVMVSHMDDDHVNGILQLTREVRSDVSNGGTPPFTLDNLWFNTFDDIIGNLQIPQVSGIQAAATAASSAQLPGAIRKLDHHLSAVIASTGQGRRLRNDAGALNASVNNPFTAMGGKANLVRNDVNNAVVKWDTNLKITVVHPNQKRLSEMQEKWDKDLKEAKAKGDDSIIFASVAAKKDTSAFNLASIVCLVEFKKKRILLTGDARDDDILDGLEELGLLDNNGKIKVDVLKIPHHGSDRNVSRDFFEKVSAKHYVISGNGSHHNPDKSTLVMLEEATKSRNNFTIHFTNHEGKFKLKQKIDSFLKSAKQNGRTFKVNFLKKNDKSTAIDLLDKLDY